jgi:topoisomerase-4 subunit A
MDHNEDNIVSLSGMYKEYFLDYASYVILERAVPDINDGLKPVQRRILHSMKVMDDGRFHKVANIIGQTMQYHPHGDAAIGAALVNLGQKDLLIDWQGNWGDIRTGDSAAAPRYIEARLTKFALEVVFNNQTAEWQATYDGRKKEPITLPVKFPLVLSQGVEGIAVGLSTKILPHNFIELIKASIKILEGKKVKIYPDFLTGGSIDVGEYRGGKRGGRVKVRAKIEQRDKSTLAITELPFGVTTNTLIDSILKANDRGQIKIKKVVDNTAKDVEILLELAPGISPELSIDALYAFTNCEASISPNACVIIDNKPHFMTVNEILEISTFRTKDLLRQELEIKKGELQEKWHNSSLEKIFIENRIYRDIEECETWEAVIEVIDLGLRKYVATPSDNKGEAETRLLLMRDITEEDIVRLTEIKIKRISKYNKFKADELILQIETDLSEVKHHLAHLTEFAIAYFEDLLQKYGKGRERRTEIASFEKVEIQQVVANNAKLYVDRKEGFVGMGMKKDEFVADCSDIADVIAFTKEGKFMVTRIADKTFIGKNIIHVDVWKKGDERTTYNAIYVDGKTGRAMAKRFHISAITRDKAYDVTKGTPGSKILYFSANPNGESEVVQVQLSPGCKAKKKLFEFDFEEIGIKGRGAGGNILTKYPIRKVSFVSTGKSSLGALKVWMDEVSGRLNQEERGIFLGAFDTGNQILAIYNDGSYEVNDLDLNKKYDASKIMYIHKFDPNKAISAVYYEGEKSWTMVKRFQVETSTVDQKFNFITEASGSKLYYATQEEGIVVKYSYKKGGSKEEEELDLDAFIDVKGWKALGNKLGDYKILKINELEKDSEQNEKNTSKEEVIDHVHIVETPSEEESTEEEPSPDELKKDAKAKGGRDDKDDDKYSPGETIELDF